MGRKTDEERYIVVNKACEEFGKNKFRLLDILWEIQRELGGIEGDVMEQVAECIGTSRVHVEGLVTFYAFFSDQIKGDIIIRLCDDIVDQFSGLDEVTKVFSQELGIKPGETTPDGKFTLEFTPCIGLSDQAPAALVNEVALTNLTPAIAKKVSRQLKKGVSPQKLVEICGDGNNAHPLINSMVINNVRRTGEVLLSDKITPDLGLKNCLKISSDDALEELKKSKLKGRGGASFPTALKWELARNNKAEKRYVICNADEGEPGTFKDRVLLTERASMMVEGMAIAAYIIGSTEGIIYLRAEYAYLQPWLENELKKRREQSAGV